MTGDGFRWIDTPAGPALVCRPLERAAPHLFTTRRWALGAAGTPSGAAWAEVGSALGVDADHLVRLHQVHGADVVVCRDGSRPGRQPLANADIVVSDNPDAAIAIQTADCVPILIADTRSGAVGAAHAGWRGLAARVPAAAVAAMTVHFGSRPEELLVAVGPSIGAARYEVGGDVVERFESAGFAADRIARWFPSRTRPGHWRFDGWQSARDQLEDAGVRGDMIHVASLCTSEHADLFCSYRRDGKGAGRTAAAIRASRDPSPR